MEPALYIVGTPIGNLGDISPRALETLRQADLVLAEDTRHTRKLFAHYDIHTPLQSCHKFNEASVVQTLIEKLNGGAAIALVSDSGMPAVSDPGSRVVAACHTAGVRVVVVPGPSAVTAGIAVSGFGGAAFHFEGFLPRKRGARIRKLEDLAKMEIPVVLFESPHRIVRTLDEVAQSMGDPLLCVARELTKKYEEIRQERASVLHEEWALRSVKGELVVVIAPDTGARD
jgi:16S rRNA (cytidine1402-2'-O)-methyltransferase